MYKYVMYCSGYRQQKKSSHAILWLLHFMCVSFYPILAHIFQFIETKTILKQKVTNRLNEVHNGHQHVGRLMVLGRREIKLHYFILL